MVIEGSDLIELQLTWREIGEIDFWVIYVDFWRIFEGFCGILRDDWLRRN